MKTELKQLNDPITSKLTEGSCFKLKNKGGMPAALFSYGRFADL